MSDGPLSRVQLAHVAREYYVNRKTRVEIAEALGLSRFKVGRMLDEAIARGVIQFQISNTPGINAELSMALRQRFGLAQGIAVDVTVDTDIEVQAALGSTAAQLIDELVGPEDILGLTSGRTLNAMARELNRLPCRSVVQLAGVAGPIQESGLEVIRRLASLPNVQGWPIYASLVMSDAQTAQGVLRQPGVRAAVEMFDEVTVAFCAIGSWAPPNSLMMANPALDDLDRQRLLERGVVAEVASSLVTDAGAIVHDVDARCVAISEEQLRAIPSRVGVAGGPSKTRAIRAVLNSGLLTGLVTDIYTAERLLAG